MSYNNLSGVMPSGLQLQTFDNQIYIYVGNPGLCGISLPWDGHRICSGYKLDSLGAKNTRRCSMKSLCLLPVNYSQLVSKYLITQ
uniref:Non-specific serine/threonine protein kinase n=1 Tax=Oryza punctata TaxID=4537 RepID=A0A0E0JKU3_ORYPU